MLLHTVARDVPAHPPLPPKQAMEYERLGPERPRYSDVARRRIAGMEAATALTCTLLPAIEPVLTVSRAQQGAAGHNAAPVAGRGPAGVLLAAPPPAGRPAPPRVSRSCGARL